MTRKRLPDTRRSITHHVEITDMGAGIYDLYMTLGLYPDGRPGELFLEMGKVGSAINGLLDVIGVLTSLLLQHGAAIEPICAKLSNTAFSPAGLTSNPALPTCTSLTDYVFRWLATQNLSERKKMRRGSKSS